MRANSTTDPSTIFLSRVHKTDDCWLWTGALDSNGDPRFHYRGKCVQATRFAYEMHHGILSDGMMVRHCLKTRHCVNPAHLHSAFTGRKARHDEPIDADKWFWSYVDKTDTCWLWRGMRNKEGYGLVGIPGRSQPRKNRAHRVAYELANGPIPKGLFVCHKCDNPSCVRPDHLFLGTANDNSQDMVSKGRVVHGEVHYFHIHPEESSRGERHGCHKMTVEKVQSLRREYDAGNHNYAELGYKYGIGDTQAWRLAHRKSWKWLQ